MKKAYALVLGIIISITMLVIPFTGAFADSDPGISAAALNAAFGWYTGFPMVDSAGYLDLNDWSIIYRSNGIDSTSTAGSGDVVYLYQPGDYVEYHFSNWDLLSSYSTPVWNIHFGQNPSYGTDISQAKYTLYQSYSSSPAFYQFLRMYTYDNRDINWSNVFFTYPGTGTTSIRIEYDGTPIIWNCIYIKFTGYRGSTDGYTATDLAQLQTSITNMLNIAQLADIINQIEPSQVDLSTLESTTSSILAALSSLPNIIQYIDQIESIDNNILSAINLLNNYYFNIYADINYRYITSSLNFYYDSVLTSGTIVFNNEHTYIFGISKSILINSPYVIIRIPYNNFISNDFNVYCGYLNTSHSFVRGNKTLCYHYISSNCLYIYIPQIDYYPTYNEFGVEITPNTRIFNCDVSGFQIYIKEYKYSIFDRIELYIRQLLGHNISVPGSVQQTTDEINQNAEAVNDFQSSTQQSLDNDLQNVPVSQYQIQATSGTQYMKAYSEALFNASNGFRIWYMLPLILFLIGMLIRWGIKK